MRGWVILILALVLPVAIHGEIEFEVDGHRYTTASPQLWYEGHWRVVDWVNGTVVHWPTDEARVRDNLVLVHKGLYPYDPLLRRLSAMRARAVIMAQETTGVPGEGMYSIDTKERKSITVPVCEVYASKQENLTRVVDGSYLAVKFDENYYRKVKESVYWPLMNSFMSLWELGIMLQGSYHIFLFARAEEAFSIFSIGPLCLTLQILAAAIRFSHTIVDPFWSNRLYHHLAQHVLMTVHLPFLLAAGVLITFYWAETLQRSRIKATPFLSRYRSMAIVVVVGLFAMEILTIVLRLVIKRPKVSPVLFALIYYLIVSIVLAVCYIICCVAIVRRVRLLGSKKYIQVMTMNIRLTLSASGYIGLIIFEILTYSSSHRKWAPAIIFYLLYVCLNWIGFLQVLSLRPVESETSASSKGSPLDTDSA